MSLTKREFFTLFLELENVGIYGGVWCKSVIITLWLCVIRDGCSPEECSSGLGSPGEPCLAPVAWSVHGKFLAAAMEKVVNIWQVNGEGFVFPF